MKKLIAITALLAAGLAAPTLPANAATMAKDGCLVLPLLRADCRAAIQENVAKAVGTTKTATMTTAKAIKSPVPMWWGCEPAPAGSKFLYTCK